MDYLYYMVCAESIEEANVSQSVDPESTTSESLKVCVTYLVTRSDLQILYLWLPEICILKQVP